MKLIGKFVLLSVTATLMMSTAEAKRLSRGEIYDPREQNQGFRDKHNYPDDGNRDVSDSSASGDGDIVKAVNNQKRVNFVEGTGRSEEHTSELQSH